MKKYMVMIVFMSTALVHGMEHPKIKPSNTVSLVIGQTTVQLTKCPIYKLDKVDLVFVGRVQQQTLKKPNSFHDIHEVGLIEPVDNNMVYIKTKDVESGSDDDTYKPYDNSKLGDAKLWETAYQEVVKGEVLSILEPRIMSKRYFDKQQSKFVDGFHYYAHRKSLDGKNEYLNVEEDGEDAIAEASKDLAFCYTTALVEGCKILGKKEKKSIALSAFGIDVGFPRDEAALVTVTTILKFIKNSPEKFSLIHLFVKKRSDFDRYKELLAHAVEQK